jgi:uncharacterized protein YndB with AHSA1/START domain
MTASCQAEERNVMASFLLDDRRAAEQEYAARVPETLAVSACVQIKAEPCRVLYALAIPEYMEAWLQFPEAERIECHPEHRSFDRFRIDLFCAGARQRSIHGSCLLSKPNRITYLWERDRTFDRPRSIVEICLWGGSTGCTLKLKHAGLWNQEEKEQLSRMWPGSLKNLCGLLEGIGSTGERLNALDVA